MSHKTFLISYITAFSIVLGLFGAAPISAQDQEGDMPFLWSTSQYFYWFKKIDPAEGKLQFLLNDQEKKGEDKDFHLQIYKDVAHVRFTLKLRESNAIIIGHGDEQLFTADVFYAPTFESLAVPDDYEPYVFHTLENEKLCTGCHRMKPNDQDIKPAKPENSMCYTCHSLDFGKARKYVSKHKPAVITWQCLGCHQVEEMETEMLPGQPVKYTIEEGFEIAPLCYKCHEKQAETFPNFVYQHGPIGEGACTMCHDPHGSKFPKLVQKKTTNLCIECHEMQDLFEEAVSVHKVIKKKGCTGCHDPHGSNFPLQLKDDPAKICYSCHKQILKMKGNHPVAGHPISGPRDPLYEDRKFSCISCHNPHASAGYALLPEAEPMMVCILCHPMDQ